MPSPRPSSASATGLLCSLLLLPVMLLASACGPASPATEMPPDSVAEVNTPPPAEGSPADGQATAQNGSDLATGGTEDAPGALVLYSGRSESLVSPLIARFTEETGIKVDVRWASTSELAATLLEEGQRSPADVFYAQDPGGLGAVEDLLAPLPEEILDRLAPEHRDPGGRWVGVSGRLRVVTYNTTLDPEDLPSDLQGFTESEWQGRVGWAPSNASFQVMVTAMRAEWGEDQTRAWLQAMLENEPVTYEGNTPLVAAVAAGEVEVGLTNHYYLHRFLMEEGDGFGARNLVVDSGGPGALMMVSGAGILATAPHPAAAQRLVAFLLEEESQEYFASETFEYPLTAGVAPSAGIPDLSTLDAFRPAVSELTDVQGTVALLQEVGALP